MIRLTETKHSPLVLCLMGPTASGKTALALALAQQLPCEIISVDSALIYRDMNIGTAKPHGSERALCPHHLIDILSPLQRYSAGCFCHDATQLIEQIHSRKNHALLVGGTMLYYKALFDGLSVLPSANFTLRAQINAQATEEGWPALHQRLAQLDPLTAERLNPNDAQRIERALEICLSTGEAMSTLLADKPSLQHAWQPLKFALIPQQRSWLHQRIAQRFEQMLAGGLIDEVAQLLKRYPTLSPTLPALRTVGYRQAWAYLQGDIDFDTFVATSLAATRQLAKRQLTWLRRFDDAIVLEAETATSDSIELEVRKQTENQFRPLAFKVTCKRR